ncbi:DUF3575 domain-containing protein [Adhaeribacter sp. BT258]|uniref:DUF3575 domain-containing protein n=1 Tax=Adhaeribacter terrigena TaxID=2793070 RepID=A0ABS1C5V5_9BACT|nr:DUF3575 domain-containing protein [Adhaeribacter terrigena]MBK0404771.1 DUF3575 domain-containing protein [Adhaeribacter terrigena]
MHFKILLPKVLLGLTFLFVSHTVFGQNVSEPAPPKNVIKLAPFAFIHGQMPFTVESRIGYERVIGKQNSLAGSYSYMGTNYPFSFLGSAALSATLTTALALYGKPGKVGIVWTETDIKASGYRYQLQFKRYLSKNNYAPEGWYVSPHYSYAKVDYDVEMEDFEIKFKVKAKNESYNLLLGYQAILGKHFVLDMFTGLGYRNNRKEILDDQNTFLHRMKKGSPMKFSAGLNMGWAF